MTKGRVKDLLVFIWSMRNGLYKISGYGKQNDISWFFISKSNYCKLISLIGLNINFLTFHDNNLKTKRKKRSPAVCQSVMQSLILEVKKKSLKGSDSYTIQDIFMKPFQQYFSFNCATFSKVTYDLWDQICPHDLGFSFNCTTFSKIYLWPLRSNLTLKANLKSLNEYSSHTNLDIFINFY